LKDNKSIIDIAKHTIEMESKAILNLSSLITNDFADATQLIFKSKGRVIITGIGKSAIIANKIVATLNSTGTPAVFMHAADIKSAKNKLIAITGNPDSFLGQYADFILNTFVEKEACPNNLAPTTSTTAQLVMGDALAICLLELRGFSSNDFAKYHPGGALGKKLYLRVLDISSVNEKPKVSPNTGIKDVIVEITEKMLGVTAVVENSKIIGIITDGDLRRMLSKVDDFSGLTAKDIMGANPKRIAADAMAIDALEVMETHGISQLLVEDDGHYAGIVHLHDLIKEGII